MEEEIMKNEEIVEAATEVVKSGCGMKMIVAFGAGVITGFIVSKIAKPIKAKLGKKYAKIRDDEAAADEEFEQDEDSDEE